MKSKSESFADWESKCLNIPVLETKSMNQIYKKPINFLYEVFWIYVEMEKEPMPK